MNISHRAFQLLLALCFIPAACGTVSGETPPPKPYEPVEGQAGKDVVWVPTPPVLVEKMLDMARVTPRDYVVDLGSGDGRNVIAAAKRGARALGVEYNPDMVELSRRGAAREGVADKAVFVQGDMFAADISQATVLALFLLPDNLRRLTPKFLDLEPGTRIVSNGFEIEGWKPDEIGTVDGDCNEWCVAYLYIVPARAAGTWRFAQGELRLEQKFQVLSGTLSSDGVSTPVANGRLLGDRITFTVEGARYEGRVAGEVMRGAGGAWSATRLRP